MTDQQWLSLCNSGDVSDYGASLTILPDSLGRSLAQRIRLLMERANSEAHLAVLLREKLQEVAGAEIASSISVQPALPPSSPVADSPTWQPIETVPRDGTEVLLTDGHWKRTGWWARRANVWSIDAAVSMTMPTHWAPLPASAPSPSAGAAKDKDTTGDHR